MGTKKPARGGRAGALRWRWDFLNPLVLNGFRGFWHCHVPPRANGLPRAGVEPATGFRASVGAMWRVWSLASQIQGFPGSPGFQALQRVFDHCSTYPLASLRRRRGRCAGHRQRPLLALVAGCAPGPDSQASVAGASPRTTKTQFGELREALTDARKPVAGPVASQIQ